MKPRFIKNIYIKTQDRTHILKQEQYEEKDDYIRGINRAILLKSILEYMIYELQYYIHPIYEEDITNKILFENRNKIKTIVEYMGIEYEIEITIK